MRDARTGTTGGIPDAVALGVRPRCEHPGPRGHRPEPPPQSTRSDLATFEFEMHRLPRFTEEQFDALTASFVAEARRRDAEIRWREAHPPGWRYRRARGRYRGRR